MVDIVKEIDSGRIMFNVSKYECDFPTFYFAVVNKEGSDSYLDESVDHVIGISKTDGFIVNDNVGWTESCWKQFEGISPEQFYEVLYSLWKEKDNE